jgi:DNA-binding beta-propeller fold protein YncE
VDFVFVTSAKAAGPNNYGEVDVFEVNSESGHMRPIPTSPFPSAGRNPVAEAVSSDNQNLYVVNQDDNNIVQFVIGNDGKLYPQNTVNTPGIYPLAVAVSGSELFVLDTYQPLPTCSTAAPCSGSLAVLPIAAATSTTTSGALGAPVANGSLNYVPLCLTGYQFTSGTSTWSCKGNETDVIVPTAVNVLASGSYAYVSAYDSKTSLGYVFGFAVGTGGALTPLNSGAAPLRVGNHPSALASDPTSSYIYVTDFANANIQGFSIKSGLLSLLSGSPFPAGNQPSAMVIDPAYGYAYVTNSQDSTVSAYSMSNGTLTRIGSYSTGLLPVAIGIDPSTNHFLYTVNFLDATVSGFELSPTAGTLLISQYSPFAANALPTAVAAIPHGSPTK